MFLPHKHPPGGVITPTSCAASIISSEDDVSPPSLPQSTPGTICVGKGGGIIWGGSSLDPLSGSAGSVNERKSRRHNLHQPLPVMGTHKNYIKAVGWPKPTTDLWHIEGLETVVSKSKEVFLVLLHATDATLLRTMHTLLNSNQCRALFLQHNLNSVCKICDAHL